MNSYRKSERRITIGLLVSGLLVSGAALAQPPSSGRSGSGIPSSDSVQPHGGPFAAGTTSSGGTSGSSTAVGTGGGSGYAMPDKSKSRSTGTGGAGHAP